MLTLAGGASIVGLWYLVLTITGINSLPGSTSRFGSSVLLFFASIFTLPFLAAFLHSYISNKGWRESSRVKAAQRRTAKRAAKQEGKNLKAERLAGDFISVAEALMSARGIDPLTATVRAHEALALLEQE